jgi:hypothetical protein
MKQTHQGMLHTHVASKNKDMNEMIDAHAYEMQCNYGSQTPEVLQPSPLIKMSSRDLESIPLLIEFLITIT